MSGKQTTKPSLTKTDLTEALDRVVAVFETKLTETRLQLERKIDWARQDAKEQLEAVDRRLSAKIEAVDQRLSAKIEAVDQRLSAKIEAVDQRLTAVGEAVLHIRRLVTAQGETLAALHDTVATHDARLTALELPT
ncbi:MAG: hypothetical protein HYV02_07335 [Deltaproteobacteria bacterium]|nr:hypothetical protein [Deltaproteobacteria bacterium]